MFSPVFFFIFSFFSLYLKTSYIIHSTLDIFIKLLIQLLNILLIFLVTTFWYLDYGSIGKELGTWRALFACQHINWCVMCVCVWGETGKSKGFFSIIFVGEAFKSIQVWIWKRVEKSKFYDNIKRKKKI